MAHKEVIDKEIALVNNLIGAAVMHGSDAGGSYEQNENDMKIRMEEYLKFKKWEDKYDIDINGGYESTERYVDSPYAGDLRNKPISWPALQFVPKGMTWDDWYEQEQIFK